MKSFTLDLELTRRKFRPPKKVSAKQTLYNDKPLQSVYDRRATVKMNYATANKLNKQLAYIGREGVGKDGSDPVLFTKKDQEINKEPIAKEKHIFRVIISPEDGQELDLESYTQNVMKQAEKTLGTKLEWIACSHYNTDKPHIHVIIRGIDDKGKPLTIDSRFIKEGFRAVASEEATKELGELSLAERQERLARTTKSFSFTKLDKELLINSTTLKGERNSFYIPSNKTETDRLLFLTEQGFVIRNSGAIPTYNIPPDLEKKMKFANYKKQMEEIAKPLRAKYQTSSPLFHYKTDMKYPVKGIVIDKGLVDEMKDTEYAVIKTDKGKLYYVKEPLSSKLDKGQEVVLKGREFATATSGRVANSL